MTGDQGDDADLVRGDNDYYAVDGEADTYEVGVVTGEILLQQQKVRGAYKYSLDLDNSGIYIGLTNYHNQDKKIPLITWSNGPSFTSVRISFPLSSEHLKRELFQ